MTKLLKIHTALFLLILTANSVLTYGQDSTKKAAAKPPVVKSDPYTSKPKYKPVPAAQTPGASTTPVYTRPVQQRAVVPTAPTDKSLHGQYQYLLTKVYNYQQPLVSALFKNYSDTLSLTRRQLKEAQATLLAQTKTIDTLKASATTKDQTLAESKSKVNEVTLLGIPVTKSTYNLIMWGLVIGFGVIAAIVIARSGSHSREAKYRTKLYNELEEEYKNYKTKANEKEKKLARELQTERNKLDELTGNS
jgi:hypothetical protein